MLNDSLMIVKHDAGFGFSHDKITRARETQLNCTISPFRGVFFATFRVCVKSDLWP